MGDQEADKNLWLYVELATLILLTEIATRIASLIRTFFLALRTNQAQFSTVFSKEKMFGWARVSKAWSGS